LTGKRGGAIVRGPEKPRDKGSKEKKDVNKRHGTLGRQARILSVFPDELLVEKMLNQRIGGKAWNGKPSSTEFWRI